MHEHAHTLTKGVPQMVCHTLGGDFFLWDLIKEIICKTKVQRRVEILLQIMSAAAYM
jgi:hypothetical protein